MATFTQIHYHLVFATKNRECVLRGHQRKELFKYIWGILKNKHCQLYRINGVEDHLHILTSVHPTIRLADLIKDIKLGSSLWIKERRLFPAFSQWQEGYAAFTLSRRDAPSVIEYIKHQEEHHREESFLEEYRRLLKEAGIAFEDKYLE